MYGRGKDKKPSSEFKAVADENKEAFLRRKRLEARQRVREHNKKLCPHTPAEEKHSVTTKTIEDMHELLHKTREFSDKCLHSHGIVLRSADASSSHKPRKASRVSERPVTDPRVHKKDHHRPSIGRRKQSNNASDEFEMGHRLLLRMKRLSRPKDFPPPKLWERQINPDAYKRWKPSKYIVPDNHLYKLVTNENYRPVLLGRGAFGRVYLVENLQERIQYALKVFLADGVTKLHEIEDEGNMQIRANKRQTGPQFRGYLPIDTRDGLYLGWAILSDVIYGQNLANFTKKQGATLDSKRWCGIMHDVVRQVAALNMGGITVRDISMANVMISDLTGKVDLVDFGKCMSTTNITRGNYIPKQDVAKVCRLMEDVNDAVDGRFFQEAIKACKGRVSSWADVLKPLKKEHMGQHKK